MTPILRCWRTWGIGLALCLSATSCATKPNSPKAPKTPPQVTTPHLPAPAVHQTDIQSYAVRLGLSTHSDRIRGIATLRFAPTSTLRLSLQNVEVVAINESKGRKLVVNDNQVALAAGHGLMSELRIVYRAKFQGGLRKKDKFIYTAFDTMDWMPVHFPPNDRATFQVTLDMPAGYNAIAPGKKTTHKTQKGRVELSFKLDRASPAYVLGFAAGPFEEHVAASGNTEHHIFHRGFSPDQLEILVAKANSAIDFFTEVSGVPHPSPSFAQVWLSDRIAQELVDMATMSDAQAKAMFKEPKEDWMLVHEISHQWWGNSVTCASWSDFWLNEAFATFMVAAYKQKVWGEAAYQREIELAHNRLERLRQAGKDGPLKLKEDADVSDAGGPIPYIKGILLLAELRSQMGEEPFWSGVRSYTQAHWLGSATSEDFEEAMQAQTEVDLGVSFEKWQAR